MNLMRERKRVLILFTKSRFAQENMELNDLKDSLTALKYGEIATVAMIDRGAYAEIEESIDCLLYTSQKPTKNSMINM